MKPEFSLAHLSALSCSPPELVTIAARAGYDFVSLRMTPVTAEEKQYKLTTDKQLLRETKSRIAGSGISVLDVELIRLDPATEPETYLTFLETAAELGARAAITQLPNPDRGRATERFARLCELAADFHISLDLEFPSWTETPTLESAVKVLKAADSNNAGLLVDTLHFDRSHSSLELLQALPRQWFHFIHICDAPAAHPETVDGIIHAARADRLFPGEGGIDIKAMLERMPRVPYSLEIPNDLRFRELGPQEYARQALAATKEYFSKIIDESSTEPPNQKKVINQ